MGVLEKRLYYAQIALVIGRLAAHQFLFKGLNKISALQHFNTLMVPVDPGQRVIIASAKGALNPLPFLHPPGSGSNEWRQDSSRLLFAPTLQSLNWDLILSLEIASPLYPQG